MRTLFVLAVLAVFAHAQVENLADCYQLELDDCIATNPAPGQAMNNSAIHCLWCHSHFNGTDAHSHCAPLQHVVKNYKPGWICDYRMPRNRQEAMVGAFQAKVRAGRHLLDVSDPATMMDETWAEGQVANWPELAQFIAGVVFGTSGQLPGDISQCLANTEDTFAELNSTFAAIVWPPTGITSAYTDVATLFKGVGEALTSTAFDSALIDCTEIGIDVAEMIMPIATKALGLTGPILSLVTASVGGNPIGIVSGVIGLVKWGIDLGSEIVGKLAVNFAPDFDAAVTAAHANEWFQAGVHIGNLIYVLAFTN